MPEGIGYDLPTQGPQQSPEQVKQNEESWFSKLKEWQASPEAIGAFMQIGSALSQPQAYGQSAQGQITNAIAETGPYLDRLRTGQRKDREQDIRTRDVSRLEAGQRSTQALQESKAATEEGRLGVLQAQSPSVIAANRAQANQRNRPPQPRAKTRTELLAGMTPAEKRQDWVAAQAAILMDPLSGVKDPTEIPAKLAEIQQMARRIFPDPPPTLETLSTAQLTEIASDADTRAAAAVRFGMTEKEFCTFASTKGAVCAAAPVEETPEAVEAVLPKIPSIPKEPEVGRFTGQGATPQKGSRFTAIQKRLTALKEEAPKKFKELSSMPESEARGVVATYSEYWTEAQRKEASKILSSFTVPGGIDIGGALGAF